MIRSSAVALMFGAILCSPFLSTSRAAATWSANRWADANEQVAGVHRDASPTADVGDVVAAIVSAKAGRSSTRMSAGLAGDWASINRTNIVPSPRHRDAIPPLPLSSYEVYDSAFIDRDADLLPVALPLPPTVAATVPGLLLAYLARRRFMRSA